MLLIRARRILWAAALVCALAAAPARAQDASGILVVYVFAAGQGTPVVGAVVEAGGVSTTTNADGVARLTLDPGSYAVALRSDAIPEAVTPLVAVVAGGSTEIVATVDPAGGVPLFDIEAPVAGNSTVSQTADSPTGRIEGRLVREDNGAGVAGARVFVRGVAVEAESDAEGFFALVVPAGTHTLSVIHTAFITGSIDAVTIPADGVATIRVTMSPSGVAMDDYVVTAPHVEGGLASMLEERRNAAAVSDLIGAEQIAKSGDSSAASALKRVTGLTVVGGRFVYVRGMGERYSSTLLNGATLPSPEPERRVVPLDMFPADILKGVIVQKTYSPDMPGEFGGGAVRLETRGLPDAFTAEVGVSGNYHAGTTGERGLMYDGGSTDWLGMDDGDRQLPDNIARATADEPLLESDRFSDRGYTAEELEKFGEDMPNVWAFERKPIPYDAGVSGVIGHRVRPWGIPVGFLLGVNYDNNWDLLNEERNYYIVGAGDKLELQHSYNFETLTHNIDLGGIFNFGVDITEDHKIQTTTILIRTTDDETRVYQGRNRDVATDIRVSRINWLERQMFFQQILGNHVIRPLCGIGIDWRYNFSEASRDEPDRREVRYDLEKQTGEWLLSDRPEGNQRLYSTLEDDNQDIGADLSVPIPLWKNLSGKFKTGFNVVNRDREVDTRRFKYQHKGPISGDPDILKLPPEEIFVPVNIGGDGFQFEENTRETDNYTATQDIFAYYLMADIPVVIDPLRLVGGVRMESSKQIVETFELFNPDSKPVAARLDDTDPLPAAILTWTFFKDMMLRGAYSKTVSRPDFRELSPATFNDVTGGRQIFGNPDIQRATIENLDARWEWYFSIDESVSLGGFHKNFDKPIETIVVPSAQQSITYQNAEGAENFGLEIDFRKNFGFIYGPLRDLYLSGNYAWVQSTIELGDDRGISTEDERPLQGQSPYVVNAMLGYDNEDTETSAALLYNVFGPRIVEVGAQNAPDIIEEPVHQLDLVASQGLPWGFKVSLKAKNLIDLEIRNTQGPEITQRYFAGREIGLGLSWRYE